MGKSRPQKFPVISNLPRAEVQHKASYPQNRIQPLQFSVHFVKIPLALPTRVTIMADPQEDQYVHVARLLSAFWAVFWRIFIKSKGIFLSHQNQLAKRGLVPTSRCLSTRALANLYSAMYPKCMCLFLMALSRHGLGSRLKHE